MIPGGQRPLFGDNWADIYDELYDNLPDTNDCVESLATLAGRGPALELGIGSGRIALPLVRRQVKVHGIEASPKMIAKLREKPGGEDLPVYLGNFAEVAVEGEYTLIYVVFNTLFHLTSQDEQVRCFINMAGHFSADGVVIIEAVFPGFGHSVQAYDVRPDRFTLYVPQRDHVTQQVISQLVMIRDDGSMRLLPIVHRYIWPSELDLMARITGLRLRERWGGWRREPFTSNSVKHIAVYERA